MKRLTLLFIIFLLIGLPVSGQDAAMCVRAYEDRNSNGQRDPGEPLLTRGLGANLLDSRGVIIQTALLDNSPTSAQGVICFENLTNQQYTLEVTSAEYTPTTLDNMTVAITDDATTRRTILDYGGQRVTGLTVVPQGETSDEIDQQAAIERIAISGAGALAAMLGSAVIGLILYLIFLRGRARRTPPPGYYGPDPRATSTSSMRRVPPDEGQ